MKMYVSLAFLVLCVVLVTAKPGGRKKDRPGKGGDVSPPRTPHERGQEGRGHDGGKDHAGKPGRGNGGGRQERPRERPEVTDPACVDLDCAKPSREDAVCGTNGQTYRSECVLLRERCKGRITSDVEVASPGRCEHPAEAGEPRGHGGPGRRIRPGAGKRPSGKTPRGGKAGKRPHKGRYPKECWGLMTTKAPSTDIDYITDAVPEGPVCTASCPADTQESPLQPVCGNNGKTYESACILDFAACITNDSELKVKTEGPCQ